MRRQFAALYCDRRFGVGADGILFLSKSDKANLKMRLFQPDESEAEMCGNGIRCLVKYARDRDYVKDACTVETLAGVITVKMREDAAGEFLATIGMPAPKFARSDIPATGEGEYKEEIAGNTVYAVNTGVPHAVIIVDEMHEAIKFVADRPKPLALYLFTRSKALEHAVLTRLSAGSVCVNDAVIFMVSPELPFGGIGNSGMGRYSGWYGFETFSHMKPVMKRSFRFDAPMRYPPYTEQKARLLKLVQ
jgi:hypothetical protein